MENVVRNPNPPIPLFSYLTFVQSVHDGDTIRAAICLNPLCHIWDLGPSGQGAYIRLSWIQAPELNSVDPVVAKRALDSKNRLISLVQDQKVLIQITGLDKYRDRYDGYVLLPDGRSVGDILVAEGLAVVWDGRGPKPVGEFKST